LLYVDSCVNVLGDVKGVGTLLYMDGYVQHWVMFRESVLSYAWTELYLFLCTLFCLRPTVLCVHCCTFIVPRFLCPEFERACFF
jgi:hypothetical protein